MQTSNFFVAVVVGWPGKIEVTWKQCLPHHHVTLHDDCILVIVISCITEYRLHTIVCLTQQSTFRLVAAQHTGLLVFFVFSHNIVFCKFTVVKIIGNIF